MLCCDPGCFFFWRLGVSVVCFLSMTSPLGPSAVFCNGPAAHSFFRGVLVVHAPPPLLVFCPCHTTLSHTLLDPGCCKCPCCHGTRTPAPPRRPLPQVRTKTPRTHTIHCAPPPPTPTPTPTCIQKQLVLFFFGHALGTGKRVPRCFSAPGLPEQLRGCVHDRPRSPGGGPGRRPERAPPPLLAHDGIHEPERLLQGRHPRRALDLHQRGQGR